MSEVVIIYTDGACKGNPGIGGWGVWLQYKGKERELCGGELETTNNRMELMAAIQALEPAPAQARGRTQAGLIRHPPPSWDCRSSR